MPEDIFIGAQWGDGGEGRGEGMRGGERSLSDPWLGRIILQRVRRMPIVL